MKKKKTLSLDIVTFLIYNKVKPKLCTLTSLTGIIDLQVSYKSIINCIKNVKRYFLRKDAKYMTEKQRCLLWKRHIICSL